MLDEIGVIAVRRLRSTKQSLGVGRDDGSYFVYYRPFGASAFDWHMHCGPYSSFSDAADWIKGIREEPYPPFEGTEVMDGDENRS